MNDDPEYREDPREVGYTPAAEQPIDVNAYEAAGVARAEEDCDGECECGEGYCNDPDEWCDHCRVHCSCTPCEYASVA